MSEESYTIKQIHEASLFAREQARASVDDILAKQGIPSDRKAVIPLGAVLVLTDAIVIMTLAILMQRLKGEECDPAVIAEQMKKDGPKPKEEKPKS